MKECKTLGLVINPWAGIGGKVGLKGSDGESILKEAIARGGKSEAGERTHSALVELTELSQKITILTAAGSMGEDQAVSCDFKTEVVYRPRAKQTTAEDTVLAARAILETGNVDLLLFAGGDGTARDIYRAIGEKVPVIGIPAGVKIHSAVYGISPKRAGTSALQFLQKKNYNTKEAEVMDLDEDLYRMGIVSPKLYGYMRVPDNRKAMQNVKARSTSPQACLELIATEIINNMEPEICYIIGAGSTTRTIMQILNLENTLIGIDVVLNRQLLAKDVQESRLWEIVSDHKAQIVLTAIGGQGHILGRGNQQISPRVIRKVGNENIHIIATKEKLLSLDGHRLLVDTGDPSLDQELAGYKRIITGLNEFTICPIGL